MKRIVITGATGLIGKKICDRLIERGDQVCIFSRNPDNAKNILPDVNEHVYWNPLNDPNANEWISHLNGKDAVIHLAGENIMAGRWTDEHKQRVFNSRVNGTKALVDGLIQAENKPGKLISASAVGYYGFSDTKVFTEESEPANDFLANLTLHWEVETKKASQIGMREARIRIGLVLDKYEGVLDKMLLPFKLFVGGPIGTGKQYFPWVHINDVVDLFLFAVDNENVTGALNAVAPETITMNQFAETLGKVLHRPSFFKVPEFVLRIAIGEAGSVAAKGANIKPERTMELGYRFQFEKVEDALKNLLK